MSKWFEKSRGLHAVKSIQSWSDNDGRADAGEDGVIVLTNHRPEAAITLKGFTLLVAAFLAFKGAVIASLGLPLYAEAIATLESGSLLEQAGAFIMRPDFASQAVAGQLLQIIQ
ncbi:MAG: hypothetical protein RIA08_00960 [Roseovarius sp.]|uniref:hypothetical protein n=1 Tax=Roseovarius sp. TaxID=1486281 RepID=UPI0032EC1519